MGVQVYGDIGTSPLYTLATIFGEGTDGQPPSPEDVVGVISLIIWVLTSIVAVEYALIVLRADDHGQGMFSYMQFVYYCVCVFGTPDSGHGTMP
jgi:K+ transporter